MIIYHREKNRLLLAKVAPVLVQQIKELMVQLKKAKAVFIFVTTFENRGYVQTFVAHHMGI